MYICWQCAQAWLIKKTHGLFDGQKCLICSWATIYAPYGTAIGGKISQKVRLNANKLQRFILRSTVK